jgi:hypothetical protein
LGKWKKKADFKSGIEIQQYNKLELNKGIASCDARTGQSFCWFRTITGSIQNKK